MTQKVSRRQELKSKKKLVHKPQTRTFLEKEKSQQQQKRNNNYELKTNCMTCKAHTNPMNPTFIIQMRITILSESWNHHDLILQMLPFLKE